MACALPSKALQLKVPTLYELSVGNQSSSTPIKAVKFISNSIRNATYFGSLQKRHCQW